MDENRDRYRDFLSVSVSRYVKLSDEEFSQFWGILRFRTLEKGEVIVRSGEICSIVAFICRGLLRYYYLKDGQEHVGHFALEGEFLSAYSSFITGAPSLQIVDALEPTEILSFTKADLDLLFTRSAAFERFGRKIAEEIIVGSQRRTASFLFDSASERYERLVAARPRLLSRVPQYLLASYIGITPQSLSRLRKQRSEPR